jgi:hypothetical protein
LKEHCALKTSRYVKLPATQHNIPEDQNHHLHLHCGNVRSHRNNIDYAVDVLALKRV